MRAARRGLPPFWIGVLAGTALVLLLTVFV
jgi:hypothetical protein